MKTPQTNSHQVTETRAALLKDVYDCMLQLTDAQTLRLIAQLNNVK